MGILPVGRPEDDLLADADRLHHCQLADVAGVLFSAELTPMLGNLKIEI